MCVCVLARQVEPVSVAGRGRTDKGTAFASVRPREHLSRREVCVCVLGRKRAPVSVAGRGQANKGITLY